ncbi:agouti signaling protein 1 [Hemiscyllium ocellatum]|uniref:agouti signaling protein 1 n=1 Tax=Hemiscyllium ocellatum TaxID=170820 RepID=UPI00296661CD|nr:agouti signaling protein 1 [Hemiscyllium ocellatum]
MAEQYTNRKPEQRDSVNRSPTFKMARTMYFCWILQYACCLLVYSHLVIEEKDPETPQNKNISGLHPEQKSKYTGISIVELPNSRKINFRRDGRRMSPNPPKKNNRIAMAHKMKKLKPENGHCVPLWGMCLPPSPPCCNPCAFCHCRFFNTVCYCRKLNAKCLDKM